MADSIQQLFDAIVTRYAIPIEQKDVDLNAPAAGDEAADKVAVANAEWDRLTPLAVPFQDALTRAHAAAQRGEPSISLDDRQPDQNAMAEALIQLLVAHDMAEATSAETEPLHYVYTITVDWPKLASVAAESGIDLDATLARR